MIPKNMGLWSVFKILRKIDINKQNLIMNQIKNAN